jgi:hypothetical protein
MTKLTHTESVLLNNFADLYAEIRALKAPLAPLQKELRKLQKEIKEILEAKGYQLPMTSVKQRLHIELATTRSQVAWTQSFVEGYFVKDSLRDTVKASAIKEKRA